MLHLANCSFKKKTSQVMAVVLTLAFPCAKLVGLAPVKKTGDYTYRGIDSIFPRADFGYIYLILISNFAALLWFRVEIVIYFSVSNCGPEIPQTNSCLNPCVAGRLTHDLQVSTVVRSVCRISNQKM